MKIWKDRYFVFHTDGVTYYSSEKDYTGGKDERASLGFDADLVMRDHPEDELYMEICTTQQSIVVKAKSIKHKQEWLRMYAQVREGTGSNGGSGVKRSLAAHHAPTHQLLARQQASGWGNGPSCKRAKRA